MFIDFDAFGPFEEGFAIAGFDEPIRAPVYVPDVAPALVPTVFLPGLLCDAALWRPIVDALADRVAPLVADLTLDDTIEAMASRVLATAPERFALVALSMGGYVALEIMRQAPERVTRLALLDTSARPDTPERAADRLAGIESLSRGKFVGITHALLATLVHRTRTDGPVADALRAMALRVGRDAFLRQQRAILGRRDARPWLPSIAIPTLVAVGEEDAITPPHDAKEMAGLIPGAELVTLSQCGHLPALEVPAETAALLKGWLQ